MALAALCATAAQSVVDVAASPKPMQAASEFPVIAPAVIDDHLEIDGDPLAARSVQTRMSVMVMVANRGPFRFLVDSGVDRTVIGERSAGMLALQPAGVAKLQCIAGLSEVRTVRLPNLVVGRAHTAEIIAPVLRERDLGASGAYRGGNAAGRSSR